MKTQNDSDDYTPAYHTLENQIARLVDRVNRLDPDDDGMDSAWHIAITRFPDEDRDSYMLLYYEPHSPQPAHTESFHDLLSAQLELRRQLNQTIEKYESHLRNTNR